jgi:hypothetical protein
MPFFHNNDDNNNNNNNNYPSAKNMLSPNNMLKSRFGDVDSIVITVSLKTPFELPQSPIATNWIPEVDVIN